MKFKISSILLLVGFSSSGLVITNASWDSYDGLPVSLWIFNDYWHAENNLTSSLQQDALILGDRQLHELISATYDTVEESDRTEHPDFQWAIGTDHFGGPESYTVTSGSENTTWLVLSHGDAGWSNTKREGWDGSFSGSETNTLPNLAASIYTLPASSFNLAVSVSIVALGLGILVGWIVRGLRPFG